MSSNDWEQRKLSELSEKTFGGGTPKTSNESFWKGNIPWIQSSDLIEGSLFDIEPRKYISQEAVDKSATKLVPENSVAIVTRVGVGKLAFMPFSYATSQDFLSLSVLKTEPQFTVYALYKKLQSELNAVQGTSIKGVTKNELLAKEIMIPCYEEQEKIGSYLHSLDHLITLHQRKCEETKTLKKYMLQKMFPQNGHSVPEIRFSGFTEDWEQRKFGEIVQKYEDPVETPAEGYMRLGIRSHAKGTFHSYVEKGKELETAKMFRVAANNFIVNITFGWEHAVAITDESDAGKLVSHRFPQYSFKEGMNPRFFKYLILDECFRHHLELSSPGGAGRNRVLKLNEMLEYKMKFPQMEEQEEIAIYFEQLDNLITLHHRKYMKYADLSVFDWEQRKLGDVFEQTANFVNPNDDDIELWSLTVEDGLTPKSERYNREFLVKKKTNFKEVRPGDIVYNPMNMTLGAVGFNGMAKSVAVSGYYTTMVANKGYDSYYINTWLKSPQAISLYKTFATGSLKEKQRVQFPTLSIIPATFPEHDEQTKIGSYFEHLDHLITLHHRKQNYVLNTLIYAKTTLFITKTS